MSYGLLADLVVVVHAAFVAFAVLGGLLALRRRWWAWVHIPTAVWAAAIELTGGVCPLTPLELHLRALAGERGYQGGFIEHYLLPVLYPAGLTRGIQLALGAGVVLINALIYRRVLRTWRRPPPR